MTISGTLSRLLMEAYEVFDYQIAGAPEWARSVESNYTITAKVEDDATPPRAQVKEMLKTLLADRFKLRLHREIQQRQILALVVGKEGPQIGTKLKESLPEARSGMVSRPGEIIASRLPMTSLATFLSIQMRRPVVDRTELKGLYDFTLRWTPDETSLPAQETPSMLDPQAPSIYAAVQEQLGLKLMSQKDDMEVLVIEHVEKPTEN